MITDPHHANAIIADGQADIVALARELIWNADWPVHAAKALGVDGANRLMPEEYSHRLDQRDRQQAMGFNRPGPESDAAFAALLGTPPTDRAAR
jgi:2,4-dienoyl-CoA reductase-like NADH-dependent reductase (Old Yellow Enzyme family)